MIKYNIKNKTDLFVATIETLFTDHPNFEEMQEAEANCRFEVNKINPRALIYQINTQIKRNEPLNKFVLFTQIGFKNG